MRRNFYLLAFLCIFFISSHAQNNALSFDGSNDYVSTSNYVVPTSGNFTVEFWAYAYGNPSNFYEFMSQGGAGDAFYIGTQFNGILRLGDTWQNSGYFLPSNQWVHIAVVKSGASGILYINGVQQATNPTYDISNATGSWFAIGRQYASHGEYIYGMIDELRIWNVARTPTEIQDYRYIGLTGAQPNLVALYNFNEGVAGGNNTGITTLPDQTGNGNDGTLNNFALTGSISNFVTGVAGLNPLPVRIIAFAATKNSNTVQLSWNTLQEQNTASFELEKSSDGINFTKIGTMMAMGNSSIQRRYTYTDTKPLHFLTYYRLKSIDINNTATYSQVALVKMNPDKWLNVYPNPARDVLQLQTSLTGKLTVAIHNSAGILIKNFSFETLAGVSTIPVDVSSLGKGIYLLQVKNAESMEKQTFIKK